MGEKLLWMLEADNKSIKNGMAVKDLNKKIVGCITETLVKVLYPLSKWNRCKIQDSREKLLRGLRFLQAECNSPAIIFIWI